MSSLEAGLTAVLRVTCVHAVLPQGQNPNLLSPPPYTQCCPKANAIDCFPSAPHTHCGPELGALLLIVSAAGFLAKVLRDRSLAMC